MTAQIIDGTAVAADLTERVRAATADLRVAGIVPGLAVVLVGTDPASEVYVRNKSRTAEGLGFHSVQLTRPASISEDDLLDIVRQLNDDPQVHGILVQMPLPDHIDPIRVIEAIRPDKDVDGLNPVNTGRLASGNTAEALIPCTPAGAVRLIHTALGGDIAGLHAVVVGRSNLVGKPIVQLLLQANCTVTIAHSKTRDLPSITRQGEILVAAVGRPRFVRGDWVKPGSTVIDVGINRIAAPEKGEGQTRIVGDVAFDEVAEVAAWITPVPKGVGPMTIAMLMANTLTAAARIAGKRVSV
ncbi:MAG: bifunctional 5,10-methylenetetrahydrofolate dehydrogenase/5,10-methenyltetrahydrofolate cyclohydrolase [Bauldia sp.]